jgi:hypothetical protein
MIQKKVYMLRRCEAQQAKKLDFVDSKSEDEGSLESSKNLKDRLGDQRAGGE